MSQLLRNSAPHRDLGILERHTCHHCREDPPQLCLRQTDTPAPATNQIPKKEPTEGHVGTIRVT